MVLTMPVLIVYPKKMGETPVFDEVGTIPYDKQELDQQLFALTYYWLVHLPFFYTLILFHAIQTNCGNSTLNSNATDPTTIFWRWPSWTSTMKVEVWRPIRFPKSKRTNGTWAPWPCRPSVGRKCPIVIIPFVCRLLSYRLYPMVPPTVHATNSTQLILRALYCRE